MNSRRVLLISYGFPPWGGAISERALMFARYLAHYGWDVTVFTSDPSAPHQYTDTKASSLLPNSVNLIRVKHPAWLMSVESNIYLRRIIDFAKGFPDFYRLWVDYSWPQLKVIAQELHPDIVLTTSPPHSVQLLGLLLKTQLGIPWVMDLRDAWISNRMARWYTPIHRLLSGRQYRRCVKAADYVFANTDELAKVIQAQFPSKRNHVVPIPSGYDEFLFDIAIPQQFPGASSNDFILLYSGGTYKNAQVVQILRSLAVHLENALDVLNDKPTGVKIYVLGGLSPKDSYPDIGPIGLGHQSIVDVPSYLLGADILIIYIPEAEANSARVLLKAYGYARTQCPILYIGPKNATYRYLTARTYVERFDLFELDRAARWILSHPFVPFNVKDRHLSAIKKDAFSERIRIASNILEHIISFRSWT